MQTFELAGAYAYRSFLNKPAPVEDFNQLVFTDAELNLFIAQDGTVTGLLSWLTLPENTRAFMDISGRMTRHEAPLIELRGVGRPNTSTQDFVCGYELTAARTWDDPARPRTALVGSVIRLDDRGQAKARSTARVVAVKRDVIEPRNPPESALIESTAAMLSGKWRRLWHAAWHTMRALSALSLAALANFLEAVIHNAMHNRWAAPAPDPDTDEFILNPSSGWPDAHPDFDFLDKWNPPKYDYFGEFPSSRVRPVFSRTTSMRRCRGLRTGRSPQVSRRRWCGRASLS